MIAKIFSSLFLALFLVLFSIVILSYFGLVKLLVVQTGSMKPTLPVKSLVVTIPTKSFFNVNNEKVYKPGEIISFKRPGEKSLITHRVLKIETFNSQVYYRTKGDANQTSDVQLVPTSAVVGKAVFWLPAIGTAADFLRTFPGIFLIVILPASLIILHEVLVISEEMKKSQESLDKKTIIGPIIVLLILFLATPAYALFNNNVVLNSNSLTTASDFTQNIPAECSAITFSNPPILGSVGRDVITGTNGNDLIFGMGGNDVINSGGGDDCIVAADGDDILHGGSGNDVIIGGGGDDLLFGGSGNDQLFGGDGNDKLNGGSGDDALDGNSAQNNLSGGSGVDTCIDGIKSKCEL